MTWVRIDFHSGEPVYKQIKDAMKNDIFSGSLQFDQALPSIRELARDLDVNANTVVRAYRELESEGYIYSRPGIGSFVYGIPEERLHEKARAIIRAELSGTVRRAHRYRLDKETLKELTREILDQEYGGEANGSHRD